MKALLNLLLVATVGLLFTAAAAAADMESIDSDQAQAFAKKLCTLAEKMEGLPVKITADPTKANGVHRPSEAGVLIVPRKDLEEGGSELSDEVQQPSGAALAYLFAYNLVPVVDDQPAKPKALRSVVFTTDAGDVAEITCLLLTVKKTSDDDWRLFVFGTDKKPLLDIPISEGFGPGAVPVAVECSNIKDYKGDVIVTVFDKYQADFKVSYVQ